MLAKKLLDIQREFMVNFNAIAHGSRTAINREAKSDGGLTMKLNRTLFVRKNVPILAVLLALLGFFGVRFDSVKSVILERLQLPPAGEPFFCTLESSTVVQNAHGEVDIRSSENFADGGCSPGFISREDKDRITFPVDGNLTYFKAGTVELCLTPQRELKAADRDFYLFSTAPAPNAIILQLVDDNVTKHPSHLRLRIKSGDGDKVKNNGRVLSQNRLEWEVGEHYHIAGTWGKSGLNLYINGKHAGRNERYTDGPKHLSGHFVVNNASTDPEDCDRPTYCIISNLVIHDAQLDPEDLGEKCSIRERWFPEE